MKIEILEGTVLVIIGKETEIKSITPDGRLLTLTKNNVIHHNNLTSHQPLDLTKLLKGHEGETFWSPCWGECEFLEIHSRDGGRPSLKFKTKNGECRNVTPHGCLGYNYEGSGGECIIWPSKENQSWENFGKDIWVGRNMNGEIELFLGNYPKKPYQIIPKELSKEILTSLIPGKFKKVR